MRLQATLCQLKYVLENMRNREEGACQANTLKTKHREVGEGFFLLNW